MSAVERNLHGVGRITLRRCPNGWIAENAISTDQFVFESTESLARQLVRLLGKAGWKVETPERDEKGHFKPKQP